MSTAPLKLVIVTFLLRSPFCNAKATKQGPSIGAVTQPTLGVEPEPFLPSIDPDPTPIAIGPAPTPAPVLPSTGGSATGDPHAVNMAGEQFDIYRTGSVEMVRIPQVPSLPGDTASLKITARIEKIGDRVCSPTYIKKVKIEGQLLGDIGALLIETGEPSRHPAILDVNFADGSWTTSRFTDKTVRTRGNVTVHSSYNGKRNSMAVKVGPVTIVLQQYQVGHTPKAYLNLDVQNLTAFGKNVGGLLGYENHEKRGAPNQVCSTTNSGKVMTFLSLRGDDETPTPREDRMLSRVMAS